MEEDEGTRALMQALRGQNMNDDDAAAAGTTMQVVEEGQGQGQEREREWEQERASLPMGDEGSVETSRVEAVRGMKDIPPKFDSLIPRKFSPLILLPSPPIFASSGGSDVAWRGRRRASHSVRRKEALGVLLQEARGCSHTPFSDRSNRIYLGLPGGEHPNPNPYSNPNPHHTPNRDIISTSTHTPTPAVTTTLTLR